MFFVCSFVTSPILQDIKVNYLNIHSGFLRSLVRIFNFISCVDWLTYSESISKKIIMVVCCTFPPSSDPTFLLYMSFSCLSVASRSCGVRFHLGGRVRLKPPRIQTGPNASVVFHPRQPVKWFRSSISKSCRSGCCETAAQGARGVHERLDGTQ